MTHWGHLGAVGAPAVAHEVGHAVNEHGGLAAARACQQQQGPFGIQHRLALLLIEGRKVPGNGGAAGGGKSLFQLVIQHGSHSSSNIINPYPSLYRKPTARSTKTKGSE